MKEREIWIDWMRVAACFMVMLTHSCEPFYLGGEGSLVMSESDAFWVAVLNTLPRAAVALIDTFLPAAYTPAPEVLQPGAEATASRMISPSLRTMNFRVFSAFAFPAVVTVTVAL